MDLKQEAAREAITLIEGKDIIGLGAGSTIAYIVQFLEQYSFTNANTKFATSSFSTLQLLVKAKLPIQSTAFLQSIDIYFDGCDQLDKQLNALKSGGGIHTQEKLLASMATEFVLVGDDKKLVDQFSTSYPLVVEVIPQAFTYVPHAISNVLGVVKTAYRYADKKDGLIVTENGNYLLDIWFNEWPKTSTLNPALKNITGIVETSLFYNIATRAIIASKNGVEILEK